jgi:hypothetical protein
MAQLLDKFFQPPQFPLADEISMNLTVQMDPVSKSPEDSTPKSNPLNKSWQGTEDAGVHERRREQAVADLKAAASSPSDHKGSRSTVGKAAPLIYVTDFPPRAPGNASSLQADRERPVRGRKAIRVFAALAVFFAGYVAALFTDFAVPELITKLGVPGMEYVDRRESTPARDELAALKRDLKAAQDEILIAKDKEAEWMRVFEEDDTKSVALSRELEDARKQITDDIAAANALRSGVSEAKDATATAEAMVQELTQALGVERGKVASLTRDREELIARSVRGAAARNEFLQERRTAELTESEWKQRLDSAIQELDQLRNLAPAATGSRQVPAAAPSAPELPATRPDQIATDALPSEGSRDRKAAPQLPNKPPVVQSAAADRRAPKLRGLARAPAPNDRASLRASWGW